MNYDTGSSEHCARLRGNASSIWNFFGRSSFSLISLIFRNATNCVCFLSFVLFIFIRAGRLVSLLLVQFAVGI